MVKHEMNASQFEVKDARSATLEYYAAETVYTVHLIRFPALK